MEGSGIEVRDRNLGLHLKLLTLLLGKNWSSGADVVAPVSSAELNNTVRKVATRAGPALPTSTEPQLREKLSLADLVAPVSDDLEILNENLQKVGLFFRNLTSLLLHSDTFRQKLSTQTVDFLESF